MGSSASGSAPDRGRAAFDHRATGWDESTHLPYGDCRLPHTERACAEAVWLPQQVLLAPAEEMADVVEAIEAVRVELAG